MGARERPDRDGLRLPGTQNADDGECHKGRAKDQDGSCNGAWQFAIPLVVGLGEF